MHEHQYTKLLHFGPKWIVFRRGRHLTSGVTRDSHTTQSQLLYSFIQLLYSHIGMLQRHGRQSDEPVGMSIAPGCEPLVLYFDKLASQITVCLVPPCALVAEHLNINSLLVQELQPRRPQDQWPIAVDVACQICIF